jgi:signal transduction histidine kinase
MNRNVERCPKEVVGGTSTGTAVARAANRIERWFRGAGDEPAGPVESVQPEAGLLAEERLKERARIARELHDTLLQGFLGASMQIHDAVDRLPADSPGLPRLSRALRLMERVLGEGRDALLGLRSPNAGAASLEQALSTVPEELMPANEASFRMFVKGHPKSLHPELQEQIYYIGREALVNALLHADATSIEAEVEYLPRRVRVVVRDNGRGIDPQVVRSGRAAHWGLRGMHERAESIGAQLRIWSRLKVGTEVEISVPSEKLVNAYA